MSEGETELHEDPEANIGREVSYRTGSSWSKVLPALSSLVMARALYLLLLLSVRNRACVSARAVRT